MCGISAVLGGEDVRARLRLLHAVIPHRGPDGEGLALPKGVPLGLAARRLKVKDLSDQAAQPMSSPDGTLWLAFNGEIDNFRELRAELSARGRAFRSQGDTEVLLAAYEEWGTGAFARLDGMWAVALADLRRRRLVLSRDRFGIKPLYWTQADGALLVASEARQILAARGGRPRAHAPLVAAHLRAARLPCLEETFFEGVAAVPPASWCEVPFDHPREPPAFHRYWDLGRFHCPDPRHPLIGYDDARAELAAALTRAVDAQRVADVPVGTLLSGGLDSSVLTALLAGLDPQAAHPAFHFSDGGEERAHAAAVAARHGLRLHECSFEPGWLAEHTPRAIEAIEEPPLSLAAVAQYRVFQLCRERGVTVVLDGQGADEVLGGYPYHQRTLLWDRLRGGRLVDLAREVRAVAVKEDVSAASVFAAAVSPVLRRRLAPVPDWIDAEYGWRRIDGEAAADAGRDPSRVNRQLFRDVRWGNVKIVLAYTDKNAMAHSIEARVPYFDRRVVELAFSLPDHYKVGGGERKRLLRSVARGTVPDPLIDRRDRLGFGLPEEAVLRGLWPSVREVVEDPVFLESPCFRARAVRELLDGFGAGKPVPPNDVWRVTALALWQRAFGARLS
jgi:asparagine synthase (glutamine-hydrolysing)